MESRPCERGLSLQISVLFLSCIIILSSASNFYDDFEITWGDERAKIDHGGQLLTLSLDQISGSGFQSKSEYLFGRIDMQLKLVSGNSAGTVTAYYLSSQGSYHDEIDFEFLGNVTGEPYIVHTNIYTIGEGGREQQFYLWFDPTKDFHTYSIVWNPKVIILLVDNIPIRVFKNKEAIGVPFPKTQPMRIYSSLWDADGWATQGGLVKTDWSNAPFTSSYRNFSAHACVMSLATASSCNMMPKTKRSFIGPKWEAHGLGPKGRKKLRWVQKYYMIYDYCRDFKRFPQGLPLECRPL